MQPLVPVVRVVVPHFLKVLGYLCFNTYEHKLGVYSTKARHNKTIVNQKIFTILLAGKKYIYEPSHPL